LTLGANAVVRGGYGALRTDSATSIINNGLISADVAAQQIRIFTQRFVNYGTIQAVNGGEIVMVPPGDSPTGSLLNESLLYLSAGSLLNVGGEFTQTDHGTVVVQLGQGAPGHLFIGGTADLDGILRIALTPDFEYTPGRFFQLMSFSSAVSGAFSSIDLPSLPTGFHWDLSTLYTNGGVTMAPAPGVLALGALAGIVIARRRRAEGSLS
jgi:hypothetical protein